MGAALGLGLAPGDVAVSLGTSGVRQRRAYAARPPTRRGSSRDSADATGRYLPLVCTLNAARVLSAAAQLLGTDLRGLDDLARSAPPGAGGLTLLPYLDGERTPNLPAAAGALCGLRRTNMLPANLARAAVEGHALRSRGRCRRPANRPGPPSPGRARRRGQQVRRRAGAGRRHLRPPRGAAARPASTSRRGAARQAAWALSGTGSPPGWPLPAAAGTEPGDTGAGAEIRARYRRHRRAVFGV